MSAAIERERCAVVCDNQAQMLDAAGDHDGAKAARLCASVLRALTPEGGVPFDALTDAVREGVRLAVVAEREACARECDEIRKDLLSPDGGAPSVPAECFYDRAAGARLCASSIRARGGQ